MFCFVLFCSQANTNVERIVAVLGMMGGGFFYAYLVGTLTSVIQEGNITDLEQRPYQDCHMLSIPPPRLLRISYQDHHM